MNSEMVPRKARNQKHRASLYREEKQERHATKGGVGIIGRLFRKARKKKRGKKS